MRIIEVIESRRWKHVKTGRTASFYGAVPYSGGADKSQWCIEIVGYTWRLDNGTIGLGRQAVKTRQEAEEMMKNFNDRMKNV